MARSSWRDFQTAMLHDLALALKCEADDLPPAFRAPKPKPLRVGIFADLLATYAPEDEAWLRDWLTAWVGHPEYVERIARSRQLRCDLDGHDCEPITDEQRRHARLLLSEITHRAVRQRSSCERAPTHIDGLTEDDIEALLGQALSSMVPIYKKRRSNDPLYDPTLIGVVKRLGAVLYVMDGGSTNLMFTVARRLTEHLPWGQERRMRLGALDHAFDGLGCGPGWSNWRA